MEMTEDCSRDCKIGDEKKKEFGVGIKPPCDAGIVDGRENRRRVKVKE